MRAAVLAYGYNGGKDWTVLKTACARLGLRLRRVRQEELGQPVGAFFGLSAYRAEPEPQDSLPGRMLVMGGLTGPQMDAFLSALKTARAGESLKAILTEHNAAWDGNTLYHALAQEQQEMEAKSAP
ncbi:MAG: DUF3783 domain-containing protein [Oscillospiraceae bacterium]|nr:DUF3783 domain-containing protein [Oscillospiraceae bacterium]